MKVLVAGFFKTGTKSMDEAFRILGYRVSTSTRSFSELRRDWLRFFDGNGTPEDLKRMFAEYDTASDQPTFYYWRDFVKAFPDIKLVLTVRDVEAWLKSLKNQRESYNSSSMSFPLTLFSPKARGWFDFLDKFFRILFPDNPSKSWFQKIIPISKDETCRRVYLEFIENVKKNAPTGQLLVFNVKDDGWGPLCKFLGCEVPDVPFPHKNKGGEITQYRIKHDPSVQEMFREMYIALAIITLLVALFIAGLHYLRE